MAAMAIAAAVQAAIGTGEKISANAKRRKAQKEFEANKYEVPSGIKSMLQVVGGLASQKEIPGSDIVKSQLATSTARGVERSSRVATSTSDVLGSLNQLYSKQMDTQLNLALAGAENYQANRLRYANALQTLGGYETEKWNYNVLYPYMQEMTAAGQMASAGNENIQSAIGSGLSIMSASAEMGKLDADFKAWKDGKGMGFGTPAAGSPSGMAPYSIGSQPKFPEFSTTSKPWTADAWNKTKPEQFEPGFMTQNGQSFFSPYR